MGYPANPTMKLYITRKHFILQTLDLGASYQFLIERETGRCTCTSHFNPLENGALRTEIYYLDIFLIAGIVPVNEILYLLVVTEADIIDSIKEQNIYTIKGVRFIPISLQSSESESERTQIQSLSRMLATGFYFSYYFDLTHSLSKHTNEGNLHEKADPSFYWNLELCRDFLTQNIDTQWFVPVIQGFVGIQTVNFENQTLLFALISRRSCERTGTRYNCRGLDDEGNVANFVETEQILVCDEFVFSLLQVRGSVPLFWEQTGMSAQIAITRSQEMNEIGLRKHAELMIEKFQKVYMLNLLSNSKKEEAELTDMWEHLNFSLSQVFQKRVFYNHFDFHNVCKGNKFLHINSFIQEAMEDHLNYYFFYMERDSKMIYEQKGVVRTNCLDCLDRTNVMQSYIGWTVLVLQLAELKMCPGKTLEVSSSTNLGRVFKNVWADNGDALSMQYTGTGSTISSVTRDGRQGFKGLISHGIKTLGRFYNANVEDASRQKCIDSLLRKRGDAKLLANDDKLLKSRKNEYTEYKRLKIRAVTWNMAGRKIPEDSDFSEIIVGEHPPDILFITFEEIVKLNPRNVLQEGNNRAAVRNLQGIIERALMETGIGYSRLCQDDLVGICLFIYAKRVLCDNISKLETDAIRVGFGGKMGNKGGVAGRFNIFDTSICILGCHLESGNEQNEARISQLIDIHNRAFQQEKVGKQNIYHISQHNVRLICGDLNFRIPLPNMQVRHKIKIGQFRDLINEDQLVQAMVSGRFKYYQEAEITFLPTYKFDFGTDVYDTSKKQRVPAWCDRILYFGEEIECLGYESVNNRISDHRPVVADFVVRVEKVNEMVKRRILEEICAGEVEEEAPVSPSKAIFAQLID